MGPNGVVDVSPYAADQADIQRKRQLAAMLQQQTMTPEPTQTSGGWAIRQNPLGGLSKLGLGMMADKKAEEQQKDLGQRYQNDYKMMVAKGLKQLSGTPATAMSEDASGNVTPAQPAIPPDALAALATFGEHPGGAALAPMAMQDIGRQRLIESLRKAAPQGSPAVPAAPQGNPMAEGGASVMAPGGAAQTPPAAPQQAGGQPGLPGPASGIPMEAWLDVDSTGKSYLQHLADQGKSSGRVNYDQNGRAYTVMANGQAQFLPGINARDKGEVVNLGGTSELRNPYSGATMGQPMPHSLTPMQNIEAPIQLGRYTFETGQQPPQLAGGGGTPAAPGTPPPVALPAAGTPPQGQPALPGPRQAPQGGMTLTPQAQAKLNADRAKAFPEARQMTELQAQDLDRLSNLAKEISGHPGLTGATGIQGKFPSVPGGPAAGAEALIDSLKAQVSGMKLQAMRNASKTGGAVGNVTEKEWPRLENMITALDPVKMGQEVFQTKLDELQGAMAKMKKSLTDSFKNEYGQDLGGSDSLSPAERIELETLRKKHRG